MAVDILLFCVRAGGGLGRHQAIGHLIGIHIRLILIISFQASDEGIESFRIIFFNVEFNTRSIKGKYLSERGINDLAEGFCKINHLSKHEFNMILKILTESSKKRSIRDFGKSTKITEFFAKSEKKNEQGIRRDRKNLL
jgi:hypothetical protein